MVFYDALHEHGCVFAMSQRAVADVGGNWRRPRRRPERLEGDGSATWLTSQAGRNRELEPRLASPSWGLDREQTGLYSLAMPKTRTRNSQARQRLIETAERLFYAEGIHSVGIDRIIAEANVAKMTLYNHFASKDELILAVLEYREQRVQEMFDRSMERRLQGGATRLEAYFGALKDWFRSPEFRGCAFINAFVELADADHPAAKFAAAHKRRLQKTLRELAVEAAGDASAAMAPALSLLVEGAIVAAVMHGSSKPADTARDAALALLA